jgi:hypothetical protein
MRSHRVQAVYAEMSNESKAEVKKVLQMVDIKAGQTAPMGFFDPLGLSAGADEKKIAWFREVEVKHGRVCMWASVGYFYGELFHPFYGGDLSGPAYQYAKYAPMNTFWIALAVAIAIPEVLFLTQKFPTSVSWAGDVVNKDDRVPGDMGFDPLGLKDSLDFLEMQNKELNNGRLAMLAWAGMVAQEMATGKTLLPGLPVGAPGMALENQWGR